MGKGSSKKKTPTRTSMSGWNGGYGNPAMQNRGTKGATAKPKAPTVSPYKAKYEAQSKATRDANSRYNTVNKKYNARMAEDSADPNRNLKASVIKGNESNTRAISSFNSTAENMTNRLNQQTGALTGRTQGRLNQAYQGYNTEMQGYKDNMGQADQDLHTRSRGQAYAGLDSGFGDASDDLQASLARRGMANSGIGAKAMGDLAQNRMQAGATAGVNAYTSAIDQSDARRNNRMNIAGTQYGANQNNINTGYQMGMSQLGSAHGNSMAVRGQALQNTLNNNQQRQANLMGYAQLGRGMAGMSQNYLQQAGTGYTNIAGQAGQTAIGIGGLNNSYNATMQNAQAKKDAKGGEALGSAVGAGAMMFSDERLKENIKTVGNIGGIDIVIWDWNNVAKDAGINDNTFGVIAQDILADHPDCVSIDYKTGYYKVNYKKLFGKDL